MTDLLTAAEYAAIAETPYVPWRGSLRISNRRSGAVPPAKASHTSASPSSWKAPVSSRPATSAHAAAS